MRHTGRLALFSAFALLSDTYPGGPQRRAEAPSKPSPLRGFGGNQYGYRVMGERNSLRGLHVQPARNIKKLLPALRKSKGSQAVFGTRRRAALHALVALQQGGDS